MYTLRYSGQFKRSYKLCKKRGYDMSKLEIVLRLLSETGTLPPKYKPHKLSGRGLEGYWECHIEPNWLLVWDQNDTELVLLLLDTGTHSDIF
ncbi:MAG: type II toxin-antitoxin system YafQ family toxin [Paludibacteraceae bacterium]|nr:type II toxin-antitoxin system YafQ family toxin [Paludibacteraceae bacterium]